MLLALSVPAGYERGPLAAEQFLTTFHQADLHRGGIELIIGNRGRINGLFIRCSSTLKTIVERQLYAAYPEAMLTELPDDALSPPAGSMTWSMVLRLDPDLFPSKNHHQFLDTDRSLADPLAALLGAVEPEANRIQCRITLSLRPARSHDVDRAKKVLEGLNRSGLWRWPTFAAIYVTGRRSPVRPIRWLAAPLPRIFSKGRPSPEVFAAAKEKVSQPMFVARLTLSVTAHQKPPIQRRRD